jgi:hypothetical protein
VLIILNPFSTLSLDQDGYPVATCGESRTTHGRYHKALYLYLQALFTNTRNPPERLVAVEPGMVYSVDLHPSLPGYFWVEKQKSLVAEEVVPPYRIRKLFFKVWL